MANNDCQQWQRITANYSFFSFITSSSGTKTFIWRRIKNIECHFKILGKVVEVEYEASIDKETLWDCLLAYDENCLICSKFTSLINKQFKCQNR